MVAARGNRPTPTEKKRTLRQKERLKYKPETASGYFEKLVSLKGKN